MWFSTSCPEIPPRDYASARAHDLHVADGPHSPRDLCAASPRAAAAPTSSANQPLPRAPQRASDGPAVTPAAIADPVLPRDRRRRCRTRRRRGARRRSSCAAGPRRTSPRCRPWIPSGSPRSASTAGGPSRRPSTSRRCAATATRSAGSTRPPPQDRMCEPEQLAITGLTVEEHQRRTVDNFVELRDLAPGPPDRARRAGLDDRQPPAVRRDVRGGRSRRPRRKL